MTHFSLWCYKNAAEIIISKENELPCKMQKLFGEPLLNCPKFPLGKILSKSSTSKEL